MLCTRWWQFSIPWYITNWLNKQRIFFLSWREYLDAYLHSSSAEHSLIRKHNVSCLVYRIKILLIFKNSKITPKIHRHHCHPNHLQQLLSETILLQNTSCFYSALKIWTTLYTLCAKNSKGHWNYKIHWMHQIVGFYFNLQRSLLTRLKFD